MGTPGWVQVWDMPPDVFKKPLAFFHKKCGGATAEHAPVKCDTLSTDRREVLMETKSTATATALVAAVNKWKVGIPKMKAKVIGAEEVDQLLGASAASATASTFVLVKNLPEDIEDVNDMKLMSDNIKAAEIGEHMTFGRIAIAETLDVDAAKACVQTFNIPHAGGVMTAELITSAKKAAVLQECISMEKAPPPRQRSRSPMRMPNLTQAQIDEQMREQRRAAAEQ
ncbi:GCP1 [Symbiodinium sp. CCMP2456]|nr:GCP1 [Symbiodinium sp. CCMP2456]